jgi:hypothetical protein
MFLFLRSPLPKIIPTQEVIAQTIQQPNPAPIPVPPTDPIATYGVVASISLSLGMLLVNGFKSYIANIGRRSEIELKAQESQNQRSQDIATTMMKQQEIFVANMMENQRNDRLELSRLIDRCNEENQKTAQALEKVIELIKAKL